MKKFKFSLLIIIVLTSFNFLNAQNNDIDEKINKNKQTINTTEKKVEKIKFKDIEYYIIEGIWYIKIGNKYVLRQAPKGAKIDFLPTGGEPVVMGGIRYYKCKGIFYKKNRNDDLYEVARP